MALTEVHSTQQLYLILKFVKAALYAVYTLQHIGAEWDENILKKFFLNLASVEYRTSFNISNCFLAISPDSDPLLLKVS